MPQKESFGKIVLGWDNAHVCTAFNGSILIGIGVLSIIQRSAVGWDGLNLIKLILIG